MKCFFKIFFFVILVFQIPFVNAEECTDIQIKELSALAKTIQIDSEFDRESVIFGVYDNYIISIQGMIDDFYILSKDQNLVFFSTDIKDGIITKSVSANNDIFYVYSKSCPNIILRTIELSMKRYNIYSEYAECDGIDGEDLNVCDEFYEEFISYEEFKESIDEYKTKSNNILEFENVGIFFKRNVVIGIILFLLIIVIVSLIIIHKKRNKLD